MANITYLLGAGASFGVVPIVKEIPGRLINLAKEIETLMQKEDYYRRSFYHYPELLRKLSKKAQDFRTIDSYARYLSQVPIDDGVSLSGLKSALAILIAYEQLGKTPQIRYNELWPKLFDNLKPESGSIKNRVSFLTWNYDLQLELSYKSLYNRDHNSISETMNQLGVFPSPFQNTTKPNLTNIFHLNGYAGIYFTKNMQLDDYITTSVEDVDELIKLATIESFLRTRREEAWPVSKNLRFHWEKEATEIEVHNEVVRILKSSDELVVIGYSFPTENRTFDMRMLNALPPSANIIIQDPNPNQEIINNLMRRRRRIRYIRNADSFYVPDSLL